MKDHDAPFMKNVHIPAEAIAMTTVATCAVILRFFSRWMKSLRYKIDDWMLAVSMVFLYALLFLLLMLVYYGLGTSTNCLATETLVSHKKTLLAFECVYIAALSSVKFAFLLMCVRAFDNHSMRVSCLILGSMILTWSIAIMAATVFQCTPISKAWISEKDGTCIDLRSVLFGNAIPNILTDIALLILPLRQVWKLVPTLKLRLQLLVVFSCGVLWVFAAFTSEYLGPNSNVSVVFASVFRFTTLFRFDPGDLTYTLAASNVWCNIECCCGLISVCLPTLGPIIQWFCKCKIFGHQPISVVTTVMNTNNASHSSHFLHKHNRGDPRSQPYDRLELRPYSPPRLETGERWMNMFGRRKSGTDQPLSTWALNLDAAKVKNSREQRSISEPLISEPLEFPSIAHAPRSAGRGG